MNLTGVRKKSSVFYFLIPYLMYLEYDDDHWDDDPWEDYDLPPQPVSLIDQLRNAVQMVVQDLFGDEQIDVQVESIRLSVALSLSAASTDQF